MGFSSASPKPSHSEPATTASQISRSSTPQEVHRTSPDVLSFEDHFSLFDTPATNHISTNLTPVFTFSVSAPNTSYFPSEHQRLAAYDRTPSYYSGYYDPADITSSNPSPTLPVTLPSTYWKQDPLFGSDDLFSPFSMNNCASSLVSWKCLRYWIAVTPAFMLSRLMEGVHPPERPRDQLFEWDTC